MPEDGSKPLTGSSWGYFISVVSKLGCGGAECDVTSVVYNMYRNGPETSLSRW